MATSTHSLGRLEKVDLRTAWLSESGDFTPWLAREENISLLGNTIDLDLKVEATEKDVGTFRADILCKDTATENWVLIENQLARTDHSHLGQLLTYASGLNAVTIVWIAERFTDEHRAALDWLNAVTNEDVNFFGLEIELWRIGDSPPAPMFNIVSKPNKEWTSRPSKDGNLNDTQRLQFEYWTELDKVLSERAPFIRRTKPGPYSWKNFSIGRSSFSLGATTNMFTKQIIVYVCCSGTHAKPHFHLLREQKDAIEAQFGEPLEWNERPDKKDSYIVLRRPNSDPRSKDEWPGQHNWLAEKLEKFHRTFRDRIKQLDAVDYEPDVTDDGRPSGEMEPALPSTS